MAYSISSSRGRKKTDLFFLLPSPTLTKPEHRKHGSTLAKEDLWRGWQSSLKHMALTELTAFLVTTLQMHLQTSGNGSGFFTPKIMSDLCNSSRAPTAQTQFRSVPFTLPACSNVSVANCGIDLIRAANLESWTHRITLLITYSTVMNVAFPPLPVSPVWDSRGTWKKQALAFLHNISAQSARSLGDAVDGQIMLAVDWLVTHAGSPKLSLSSWWCPGGSSPSSAGTLTRQHPPSRGRDELWLPLIRAQGISDWMLNKERNP